MSVPIAKHAGKWAAFILITFFLTEVIFRFFKPCAFFAELVQPNSDYNHTYPPHFRGKYVQSTGTEKYKLSLFTNSLSLCQPEEVTIPKPNGVYRILVIGDSFVAGLNWQTAIPHVLQTALAANLTDSGKRLEVVNCGQISYSPILHLARLMHQYIRLEPDAILLMPDLTDVFDDNIRYRKLVKIDREGNFDGVAASPQLLEMEDRFKRYGFYSTNSYVIRGLIKKALKAFMPKIDWNNSACTPEKVFAHCKEQQEIMSPDTAFQIEYTVGNIQKIIEFSHRHSIHIAIIMYPHLPQIVPEKDPGKAEDTALLYNRFFENSTRVLCENRAVTFKSFYEEIARKVRAGKKLYLDHDTHFNEEGLKILSSYIADWIIRDPCLSIGTNLIKKRKPNRDNPATNAKNIIGF